MLSALVLDLESEQADRLSDALLAAGALSVNCADARAGTPQETECFADSLEAIPWPRTTLTALFSVRDSPEQLLRLACANCDLRVPPHEVHAVPDENWIHKTREQFKPIRISARLWIVPTWHATPDSDAINLFLDPGLAFGTGSHPTTRLCLQWLERTLSGGETVLDYGCGSGILCIAALKLGAHRAVGVDIDQEAISVARVNARNNNVSCEFVAIDQLGRLTADIVIANILANPLKVLAPALASRCEGGSRLALSGILPRQVDEIVEQYSQWVAFEPPVESDGWVCLSGMRLSR